MYPVYPEKMFQLVAAPAKIKVKTAMVVTAGLLNNSGNTSDKARGASATNVLLFFMALLSSPIKSIKSIAAMMGNQSMKRASPFSLVEEQKVPGTRICGTFLQEKY